MPQAKIILDLTDTASVEGSEFTQTELLAARHVTDAIEFGRMPRGMKSGAAAVMICGRDESGALVIIETSLAIFHAAALGMQAREEMDHRGSAG